MPTRLEQALATMDRLPEWNPNEEKNGRHRLEVLYGGGDLVRTYDPENQVEADIAEQGFNALLALGYAAMVTEPPEKEGVMHDFDVGAQVVVLIPQICGGG